jgi:protein-disulfide isomerase
MASRAQQKQEARERRLAEEHARAERAARTRRLQMLAGVIVIAIVVVVVAVVVSTSSSSGGGGIRKGNQATKLVTGVSTLLAGIPQSGETLGSPSAPVTMTYWGDLQCPICASFTTQGGFEKMVANQVRQGKVKIVYKSDCTATCNNQSGTGGAAYFVTQQAEAYAAGLQGKFWQYAELFYRQQGAEGSGYATQSFLNRLAAQVPGLNTSKWQANWKNPSLLSAVNSEASQGATAAPNGTPTVYLSGPKGRVAAQEDDPTGGVISYSSLEAAYKQVA